MYSQAALLLEGAKLCNSPSQKSFILNMFVFQCQILSLALKKSPCKAAVRWL